MNLTPEDDPCESGSIFGPSSLVDVALHTIVGLSDRLEDIEEILMSLLRKRSSSERQQIQAFCCSVSVHCDQLQVTCGHRNVDIQEQNQAEYDCSVEDLQVTDDMGGLWETTPFALHENTAVEQEPNHFQASPTGEVLTTIEKEISIDEDLPMQNNLILDQYPTTEQEVLDEEPPTTERETIPDEDLTTEQEVLDEEPPTTERETIPDEDLTTEQEVLDEEPPTTERETIPDEDLTTEQEVLDGEIPTTDRCPTTDDTTPEEYSTSEEDIRTTNTQETIEVILEENPRTSLLPYTFSPEPQTDEGVAAKAMTHSNAITKHPNMIQGNGSSQERSAFERMTPDSVSQSTVLLAETDDEQSGFEIVTQSLNDFVLESHRQIRQFSTLGNSLATYSGLFDSITATLSNSTPSQDWSDGRRWFSLLESGQADRQKGTIMHCISAIGLSQWHASQVQRMLGPTCHQKQATQSVSARVLLVWQDGGDCDITYQDERRKKLNTHLARGRKWLRLVKELGWGILFKNPWGLAKSADTALKALISELSRSSEKMLVLGILNKQLKFLLENGTTDLSQFHADLRDQGLWSSRLNPSVKLHCAFHEQVHGTTDLLLKGTGVTFSIDSLGRSNTTMWHLDFLFACLYLSDRLAFVKVGKPVPLSRRTRAQNAGGRPLRQAAKWIAECHLRSNQEECLVGFFLLDQKSHYSLLEVNEREGAVLHFDPMGKEGNHYVKGLCEEEFPKLQYIEKEMPIPASHLAAGPAIFVYARHRMVGQPMQKTLLDVSEIRDEAAGILYSAWQAEELVAGPGKKKPCSKRTGQDMPQRFSKRLRMSRT